MKLICKDYYKYSNNKYALNLINFSFNNSINSFIAQDPLTPISILKKLSKNESEYVRRNVAQNPSTPDYILDELSEDNDWATLHFLARNKNTPILSLIKLSKNIKNKIKYHVFRHPTYKKYKEENGL